MSAPIATRNRPHAGILGGSAGETRSRRAGQQCGLLQRIRAAFPDDSGYDETDRGKALNRGVEAAHGLLWAHEGWSAAGLLAGEAVAVDGPFGVAYDPLTGRWSQSHDTDVNYMMTVARETG